MTALLDTLRRISGAANVLHEGDLSAWEMDWRKRSRGKALAVVRPANAGEVAAVVRAWSDRGFGARLALLEVALCVVLFVACVLHVRLRQRGARP